MTSPTDKLNRAELIRQLRAASHSGCTARGKPDAATLMWQAADALDDSTPRSATGTRFTVDEVKGHEGKPVAAPCALNGCQLSARSHAQQKMPAECVGGCPPNQVCDWCQTATKGRCPKPDLCAEPSSTRDIYREFYERHAVGSKVCPSCLLCGQQKPKAEWAITHAELADIYICTACVSGARSAIEPRPFAPIATGHWFDCKAKESQGAFRMDGLTTIYECRTCGAKSDNGKLICRADGRSPEERK